MSEQFRSKYEVIKILRDLILKGLSTFSQSNWDCMEFGQATFQNADRIVTLNLNQVHQVGFQAWNESKVGATAVRTDDMIEEQHWQLQVILKRKTGKVNGDTMTAEDVASMLITWFNGQGALLLKNKHIGILHVDRGNVFVYNDDSDVYQKRAAFTVRLHVSKEFTSGIDEVAGWQSGIYPV